MTKFWTKRIGSTLCIYDTDSAAEFEHVPWRTPLRTEVTQPRNYEYHKLFFALCSRIARGIGKDTDFVVKALKIETGRYTVFTTLRGREVLQLDSIAFHNMDAIAFKSFFEECVAVIYEKWNIEPASVADLLFPQEQQYPRLEDKRHER